MNPWILQKRSHNNESCFFCSHIGCHNVIRQHPRGNASRTCLPGECCRHEYVCEFDDYQPMKKSEEKHGASSKAAASKSNKKMGKKEVAKSNDKEKTMTQLKPVKVGDAALPSVQQLQKVRVRATGLWEPKSKGWEPWQWKSASELVTFLTPVENTTTYNASFVGMVLRDHTPYEELLEAVNETVKAEMTNPELKNTGSQVYAVKRGRTTKIEFLDDADEEQGSA
eukprot:g7006.t1